MAAGIEHRSIESIMDVYNTYDKPNFSIWAGPQLRVKYEEGNMDLGYGVLQNYLQTILNANTQTVYTLRVYDEGTTKINNKTPYEGSTTFMLSQTAPVRYNEQGVMVIDRGGGAGAVAGTGGNVAVNKQITDRLDNLEAENRKLLQQVHEAQLENLRNEFRAQISGITAANAVPVESIVDKIDSFVNKLLDKVEPVYNLVQKLKGGNNDYIVNRSTGMAGTTKQTEMAEETEEQVSETPVLHRLLTEDERKLSKPKMAEILKAKLLAMDQEELDEIQMMCLERIELRISGATLTRMLVTVDALDDHDMNKLLNNLD